MPHVLARVTIAEISADQNVCKIVYENNFNLLNVAFAGASRAEAGKSRLQTVRQIQALEAANVCNLTAAQNAKGTSTNAKTVPSEPKKMRRT